MHSGNVWPDTIRFGFWRFAISAQRAWMVRLIRNQRSADSSNSSLTLATRMSTQGMEEPTGMDALRSISPANPRSEEHTSELPVTNAHLVCRLLLEKKNKQQQKSRQ